MQQRKQIPIQHRLASFAPATYSEDTRTVEVTWTTGADVTRTDWWTGEQFIERLSLDSTHVDLSRLNNGAPVLANHDATSLDSVIGVVERAWLAGNEGRAMVRFSERDDVQPIIQDVRDGILRNISVGYKVRKFEVNKQAESLPIYRAVDWQPMEISLVTIPADASAQVRAEHPIFECEFLTAEGNDMADETVDVRAEVQEHPAVSVDVEKVRADAAKAERQRVSDIRGFARKANLDDAFVDQLIDSGASFSEAKERMIEKWSARVESAAGTINSHMSVVSDAKDKFIDAAAQAILGRAGIEKMDGKNEFRGFRLIDIARECVERNGGRTRGRSEMEFVRDAFTQGTSDFPVLLENAMHKTLQNAYALAADSWSKFCSIGSVSDFRAHKRYRLGSFGNLDDLGELSEYKNKAIPDGESSSITVSTKGNIINISRQTIINDDLGAFIGLAQMLGRAARRSIEVDVFDLLSSNPTMSDGNALFSANHGNIQTTGVALPTVAAIDDLRQLMAKQKDISGNDYLNIRPAYWIGSLAAGGTARVVNDAQYDPDTANKLQRPNMVRGLFREVIDTPYITTPWYIFADPNEAPVIEVAFLNGNQAPYLEQETGFEVDGSRWKVRIDYGVAVIDYRGACMNDGSP